jgi:hypothetical protein
MHARGWNSAQMLFDPPRAAMCWIETSYPMAVCPGEFMKVEKTSGKTEHMRVLAVAGNRVRVVRMRTRPFPIWLFSGPVRRLRRRVENFIYDLSPE